MATFLNNLFENMALPSSVFKASYQNKISKTRMMGYKRECKIYRKFYIAQLMRVCYTLGRILVTSEVTIPAHIIFALYYDCSMSEIVPSKQGSRISKNARSDGDNTDT